MESFTYDVVNWCGITPFCSRKAPCQLNFSRWVSFRVADQPSSGIMSGIVIRRTVTAILVQTAIGGLCENWTHGCGARSLGFDSRDRATREGQYLRCSEDR